MYGMPAGGTKWFAPQADGEGLVRAGFKPFGGGTHQSKTVMLTDLNTLIAARGDGDPRQAIIEENVLGKPSHRARIAAFRRLRELYGLGEPALICRVLLALWPHDLAGRPMLALLCALARDPTLRDGADAILDAVPGERVRSPLIAAAYEAQHPGRLGAKMAASLSRNAASSWTQAGFLDGAVRKVRVRARATPTTAAYAALLASLCGFGGRSLLESSWLDVLDRPIEDRLALLRQAEGLGLVRVRGVGAVIEVGMRGSLADETAVRELVHG